MPLKVGDICETKYGDRFLVISKAHGLFFNVEWNDGAKTRWQDDLGDYTKISETGTNCKNWVHKKG